jgi:hypothetical protein
MTCANYLGYACSCGGEWLEMAKVQIRRTDHNQYLVYTSVSHIHLRQPYTRHGPPCCVLAANGEYWYNVQSPLCGGSASHEFLSVGRLTTRAHLNSVQLHMKTWSQSSAIEITAYQEG